MTKRWACQLAIEEFLLSATDECLRWPYVHVPEGYGHVTIDGKMKGAHRVICERAHGTPPTSKHEAAHYCGIRDCCNPRHIRWATHVENQRDQYLHGTARLGSASGTAKINENDVRNIRTLKNAGYSQTELAVFFDIGRTQVRRIIDHKSWRHVSP